MKEFLEIVGFGLLWCAWFGGGVITLMASGSNGRLIGALAGLLLMITCVAFFWTVVLPLEH